MPSGITKAKKNRRSTRSMSVNRPQPTTPIGMTAAAAAGSVLTITFDQPVMLRGVPQYTTDVAGADPLSAVLTAPNILALTFDAAVAAATVINIPYEEPGIRNSSGGFVSHTTFPV